MSETKELPVPRLDPERTDAFPEGDHPCIPAAEANYRESVARGQEVMARSAVVLTGLCRDIAPFFPYTRARISRLMGLFRKATTLLYENDSADETPSLLADWSGADPRVQVTSEILGAPRWPSRRLPERGDDLATYRNRCLDLVAAKGDGAEFVIVLDTDLPHGFSFEGIAHTLGQTGWDAVGSNGLQLRLDDQGQSRHFQFDAWAFRDPGHPEPHLARDIAPRIYSRGAALVPVLSCFGGLMVYQREALSRARYRGGDCEHVGLHLAMAEHGYSRIYLNPSQIVVYPPQLTERRDRT